MAITPVDLNEVIDKAGTLYQAAIILAKRARQINEEMKNEFTTRQNALQIAEGGEPVPDEESDRNPDQELLSREFERREKPTEAALRELLTDKLDISYPPETPEPKPEE